MARFVKRDEKKTKPRSETHFQQSHLHLCEHESDAQGRKTWNLATKTKPYEKAQIRRTVFGYRPLYYVRERNTLSLTTLGCCEREILINS